LESWDPQPEDALRGRSRGVGNGLGRAIASNRDEGCPGRISQIVLALDRVVRPRRTVDAGRGAELHNEIRASQVGGTEFEWHDGVGLAVEIPGGIGGQNDSAAGVVERQIAIGGKIGARDGAAAGIIDHRGVATTNGWSDKVGGDDIIRHDTARDGSQVRRAENEGGVGAVAGQVGGENKRTCSAGVG